MGGQGKRARAYSTQTLCDPDPGGMNEWRDSLLHIPLGGDLLKVHLGTQSDKNGQQLHVGRIDVQFLH